MSNYLTNLYRFCKKLAPITGKKPENLRKIVKKRIKEILEAISEDEFVEIFLKTEKEEGNGEVLQ